MTLTNWAGNVTFGAARLHTPGTVDELREAVAASTRLRPLGTGHSFNLIADTDGDLVSVASLPTAVHIDSVAGEVTASAGVRYGELASRLHAAGYALHNMASLPHISVAGAVATGTHGSGVTSPGLGAAVTGLRLVTADGELLDLRRDDPRLAGAVVNLGALGVVVDVTLRIRPTFDIAQYVYERLPWSHLATGWAEIMSAGYSVSLFTDWTGPVINQIWVKRDPSEPAPPTRWHGATLATAPLHPVPGMSAVNCTEQGGVPGPWHERLPHFRLDFTPSSGAELQTEYLLPATHALEALEAVDAIRDRIAPVLQISEVRTIAADDLWLSPSHGHDSVAIHFTWHPDAEAVAPVVTALEERLAPFGARPHWGKVFSTDPAALRARYPRFDDFLALRADLDPSGKLLNPMLSRYFDL
ncbi:MULTISPECIES: D-arabinono-1,4-lactone oxidase [Catenuloplanes]|uniref:Xylitol oxidase n=1 Tax=Catenuloplanes niger TaxID=587534 RepID=A0AAE4CT43_9ACTN|nr:D-arabinono-1,4-lactone oxidase [Catenuloplanes niger]MDR7321928.1 xylitol oxidase [Catenuloplanes niger]